ncbi:hypothetical protein FBULB1_3038 [Fusarium bulbicola]|nr:hypothetical protein FBULB1_3038 [Fusarium bulbicola]
MKPLENITLSDTHGLLQNPAFRRFCANMFERVVGLSFNENDGWTSFFHLQLQAIVNSPCLFLNLLLQAWDKARVIDLDLHPIIDIDDHSEFEGTILNAECIAYAMFSALIDRT